MWVNWRKYHQCENFEVRDAKGRCSFCRLNEDELLAKGLEAIPWDTPGVYGGETNPRVKFQSILNESKKPS